MELKVFGVGTLTTDAELKSAGSATVANASLAFNRNYKAKDEWKQDTAFVRVKVWGSKAEVFANLKKGQSVFVEGFISQESWTDKEGNKHSQLVIQVNNFQICENTKKEVTTSSNKQSAPPKNNKTAPKANNKPKASPMPVAVDDDDDENYDDNAPPF